VKIKEINRQLTEGFLDNLVSKITTMAGGDGPTGVVRAMRGQNAAIGKFADAIANATTPKVMQRVGNQLDAIKNGTAALPVSLIYKQSLPTGVAIAAQDNIEVDAAAINQAVRANRTEIEQLVLTSNAGNNNQIKLVYDAVLGGTLASNIGVEFDQAVHIVALIVAAAIIFVQTQKEDSDVTFDPATLEKFKANGSAVIKILFMKDSPDLQAIGINAALGDVLSHILIVEILTNAIKNKYLNLTPEQYAAAAAAPPMLIDPNTLTRLLSSHVATEDAAAVKALVAKVIPYLQEQFKQWLTLAATESAPGHPASFDLYKVWYSSAMDKVEELEASLSAPVPGKQQGKKPAPQPAATIPPITPASTTPPASNFAAISDAASKLSQRDKNNLIVSLSNDNLGQPPKK